MRILISGASGRLGRLTAEQILGQGAPEDLVLVSRSVDSLSNFADRGVEVRAGDFDDRDTLAPAFEGIDRMLLISTDAEDRRVAQHRAAIDAAKAAGVGTIVYTSFVNPSDSNPSALAVDHRATEHLLYASGLDWTILRNSIYADMALLAAGFKVDGKLYTNHGAGRTGYVARADVAASAAAVLLGDGHEGKAYDITGPEAHSPAELIDLNEQVTGESLEPVILDDRSWIAAAIADAGLPEAMAHRFASVGAGARLGYLEPTSTTVADLTGRPPLGVAEVLAAQAGGS